MPLQLREFFGRGESLAFFWHVYGRNREMFFAGLALAHATMLNPVSGLHYLVASEEEEEEEEQTAAQKQCKGAGQQRR